MDKVRVIKYCDNAIGISLCAVAFYIPISNALIESFAGVAIAAWLIKKVVSGEFMRSLFPHDFLSLSVWIYVALMFVSTVLSTYHAISIKSFICKTAEYLMLFFIASQIRDKRILRNILIVFVFSVFLVGVDGAQQYFTGFDFLRNRPRIIAVRINGPFMTPNDFSNYLITLLPVVASFSFMGYKRKWIRPFLGSLSILLLLCLVFAATRAAWMAVLMALPMAFLLRQRKLFMWGMLVIILAVCLMPLLSSFAQSRIAHFFYAHESGLLDRKMLWKIATDMFAQKPFFGQGLGTFMFNFDKFRVLDYPSAWKISYAHNCFLQMAAETGLFGLLSFCAVISTLFYFVLRSARSAGNGNSNYIICGLWLGIFAFLVNSFFDTGLYSLPLAVLFWMMMGLTVSVLKMSEA